MKIGELSRRTGASIRALRYYEEQGLLAPERMPSGYREYDDRAVAIVNRIRVLLSAGLGTSAIAEILPNVVDDSVVLTGRCPELHEGLAAERARITQQIEDLMTARDILDSLVGRPLVAQAVGGHTDSVTASSKAGRNNFSRVPGGSSPGST